MTGHSTEERMWHGGTASCDSPLHLTPLSFFFITYNAIEDFHTFIQCRPLIISIIITPTVTWTHPMTVPYDAQHPTESGIQIPVHCARIDSPILLTLSSRRYRWVSTGYYRMAVIMQWTRSVSLHWIIVVAVAKCANCGHAVRQGSMLSRFFEWTMRMDAKAEGGEGSYISNRWVGSELQDFTNLFLPLLSFGSLPFEYFLLLSRPFDSYESRTTKWAWRSLDLKSSGSPTLPCSTHLLLRCRSLKFSISTLKRCSSIPS